MNGAKQLPDCVRFPIGAQVFHKTEPEKLGIVVAITFYPGGHYYEVQWSPANASKHYDCELNAERGFETVS